MLDKIKLAMGNSDTYVITDAQGNEVLESEGTTGSCYWRQNSRKLHAVERAAFRQWQLRRAQMSRRHPDTSALQDLKQQVEELLEASQGLEAVSQQIQSIVSSAERAMTRTIGTALKETFSCSICTGIMENPVLTSCCRSIVGCKLCVNQWEATSAQCPKCRSEEYHVTEVAGLSSALDAIKNLV
ncbi:E3 ubiquitin-protein ligase rnf8-A-like [Carassius gibelio]|uniref:E3 ubiquitin-protein ligase rnf8-A-like n=1 Tax=Carassius gibelio TaxID=101364 RepID=UPI002279DA8B|nr:E3 ubiquitin-protein ligase rnf8-A-like [Carassius gibelio]XP_052390754.1 E3 ubiquitin-protein ligase rnf8-A-like [Carassius gibelio]